MIWVHSGSAQDDMTVCSMAIRLAEHCDPSEVLITKVSDTVEPWDRLPAAMNVVAAPQDAPTKARAFFDQWHPESLIFVGGMLRPALLRVVQSSKLPATLINADSDTLWSRGGARWMPGAVKASVAAFKRILTADGATARRLIRGGVSATIVDATGPILEEPIPLPYDQYEGAVMAEALETRPVWYAADIVEGEIDDIATAHLSASRKSHRLLMVVTPRDLSTGPAIAEKLRAAGLKVGVRSEGDDPDSEQQVYVADLAGEIGLWCRLAPLTFIGGTLAGGGAASPFDPIVLGSAIVHGPHKAPHDERFARLAKAEACREVRSAAELGIAISTLSSPEQTARMALAGWDEITQNADTLNRLVHVALNGETAA